MAFMHTWTTHRSIHAIMQLLHIISLLFKAMPLFHKCFSKKKKEEAKLNSLNSLLIKELASSRGLSLIRHDDTFMDFRRRVNSQIKTENSDLEQSRVRRFDCSRSQQIQGPCLERSLRSGLIWQNRKLTYHQCRE